MIILQKYLKLPQLCFIRKDTRLLETSKSFCIFFRGILLFVLMSILSKLLLSFMRCYLLSLPFLSAGHVNTLLFIKIDDNSRTTAKSQDCVFLSILLRNYSFFIINESNEPLKIPFDPFADEKQLSKHIILCIIHY